MDRPNPKRKAITPAPKHGAHAPKQKKDSDSPPIKIDTAFDPEDLASSEPAQPDELPWEDPEDRTLRESWEDPDEPLSL